MHNMARQAAYRKKNQNGAAMIMITFVVLMILVVVLIKSTELREKKAYYEAREAELMEQIAEEEARSEQLAEYEKYTQTKKYYEDVAKDKLGMVYEGEIVFKEE